MKINLEIYKKNKYFFKSVERFYIKEYLRWILLFVKSFFYKRNKEKKENQEIFIYTSSNQKKALKQLKGNFTNTDIFKNGKDINIYTYYQIVSISLLILLLVPLIIVNLVKKNNYYNCIKILSYIIYVGFYVEFSFNKKIKNVFVANDHLFYFRALACAANKKNIKLTYVQHGSIGKFFPCISIFNQVYLDDVFSLNRYKKYNNNTNSKNVIFLNQSKPNISNIIDKKYSVYKNKILVCLNDNDELEKLPDLLNILEKDKMKIKIRLHHYVCIKKFKSKFNNYCMETIYDNYIEESLEYADICIAGESTVLIDSLKCGVKPLYYDFYNGLNYDYYGFIENEVVAAFEPNGYKNISRKKLIFQMNKLYTECNE